MFQQLLGGVGMFQGLGDGRKAPVSSKSHDSAARKHGRCVRKARNQETSSKEKCGLGSSSTGERGGDRQTRPGRRRPILPGSRRPFPDFAQPGVLGAAATAGQRPIADVTTNNTVCQGLALVTPWACGVGARGWPTIDFWMQSSVLQRASSKGGRSVDYSPHSQFPRGPP